MSDHYHILFVCSGNACRSPMAEGLLKKRLYPEYGKKVTVSSAGTLGLNGNPATPNAITVAKEKGVDISKHLSKSISEKILSEADLILVMADHHTEYINTHHPEFIDKVFLLTEFGKPDDPTAKKSIDDPIGEGLSFYRKIINQIDNEINRILPELKKQIEKKIKR